MNPDPNPYAPPQNDVALDARAKTKPLFLFAGGAAWLAAAWWGIVAALTLVGGTAATPALQLVLPLFLVVAYGLRGAQIMKGDIRAAQRILLLHGVGAVAAIVAAMSSKSQLALVLNGVKAAINVLGMASAYWARRAYVDLATRRE